MSIKTIALFGVAALMGCASGGGGSTSTAPAPTAEKAAPGTCTVCMVEVENRLEYQIYVLDGRDAQTQVGELKPLGSIKEYKTAVVQANGYPSMGIAYVKDESQRPTASGSAKCRREAPRPGTNVDYRFVCGR